MKRLLLCFVAVLPLGFTAACGQKGALYLPPRNGTVVTRPAGSEAPPQTTNQSSSPQDTTTLPSTTSESTPSGTLKQDPGPATQATGSKQSGSKPDESNSQNPPPPPQKKF